MERLVDTTTRISKNFGPKASIDDDGKLHMVEIYLVGFPFFFDTW
jgi:hypothetical protein